MGKQENKEISQEILYKLGVFEKNLEMLNQQSQLIDRNIIELTSLNSGMDEIKGSVGKEVLAQLGRGIFVKTKLVSNDIVVDVGGKTFVKKSIPETKKIIEEQIEKLNQIQKELENEAQKIDVEMSELVFNSARS